MSDTDEPQYRQYLRADCEVGKIRDFEENDDGTFSIRMPIASTGEVRNEGDDPLSQEEIDGMAQQLADRQIGVFPAHGRDSTLASGRYSPFEKMGYWDDGSVEEREESDDALLIADARLMDPDDLPNIGPMREGLGVLKEQAKRGIAQDASIGWRDDESFPGGVDLMEASIVGIGADWRTNSATEATAMARAAVEAGADPSKFVESIRAAVMGAIDDNDPEQRHLSDQQAEMARVLVDAYREAQGDGSVENFESWLFNVAWHEFDDDQFHAAHTALQEWFRETSPLDEPVSERLVPFLNDRGDGDTETNEMTESNETEPDGESGTETDEEQDEESTRETPEWAERMITLLEDIHEATRPDDDDDDDDEDEDENAEDDDKDGEEDDDDEDEEQDADEVSKLHDALDDLRAGGVDVSDIELPDADDEQDADDTEEAAASAEDTIKQRLR